MIIVGFEAAHCSLKGTVSMGEDELSSLVSAISFNKEKPVLHVIPGVLLALFTLTSLYYTQVYLRDLSIPPLFSPVAALLLAFTASSTVSVFYMLRLVKKHLYESSITAYYFTRGKDFKGALSYVRNAIESSTLPSPVTGMLLVFMLPVLGYLVLLVMVKRALVKHVIEEERTLLGYSRVRDYSSASIAMDLALSIISMGLYTSLLAFKIIGLFNNHVSVVHGNHPNPPAPLAYSESAGTGMRGESALRVISAILLVAGLSILYSYMGFPISILSGPSLGLLWFSLNTTIKQYRYSSILVFNVGLAYLLLAIGVVNGVVGYRVYSELLGRSIESLGESLRNLSFQDLTLMIFLNNFYTSIASITPFGSVVLSTGVFNAGVVIGLKLMLSDWPSRIAGLLLMIHPYAILELSGYAVLASSVTRLSSERKYLTIILAGMILLATAALIEASLIVQTP
ncbi:MAG: hypothetical protein OWQ48_00820 [Desulfurococcus sp.]|nr:hypothetical protein [Desulfurococcus sp.]